MKERIRRLLFRKDLFWNMLGIISIGFSALILIFCLSIYRSLSTGYVQQLEYERGNSVVQIKNNLEQQIKRFEYSFAAYSSTPSFEEIVNSKMEAKDFLKYREVVKELNYLTSLDLENTGYTLVSLKNNWEIKSGSLQQLSDQTILKKYGSYVNSGKNFYWKKKGQDLILINLLPTFSDEKTSLVTAQISSATLNNFLNINNQKQEVQIMDNKDHYVYGNNQKMNLEAITNQISENTDEGGGKVPSKMAIAKTQARYVYSRSSYNDWIYYEFISKKDINRVLLPVRISMIAITFILLILMNLVIFIFLKYIFQPIDKISHTLSVTSAGSYSKQMQDVYLSLTGLVGENQTLQETLQEDLPQLKAQFVSNIVRHRLDQLEEKMCLYYPEYPSYQKYAIMVLQIDRIRKPNLEFDLAFLAANRLLNTQLELTGKALRPIFLNENTLLAILCFSENDEKAISKTMTETAQSIQKTCFDELELIVSLGFSPIFEKLSEAHKNKELAKEALQYRINFGKASIIFYNDISPLMIKPSALEYPDSMEQTFFDSIRLGDMQAAQGNLYPILAYLVKHNRNPANFEMSIIRFITNLIQLGQSLGSSFTNEHDGREIYRKVLNSTDPEAIEKVLVSELVEPLTLEIFQKNQNQFQSISAEIVEFVQKNYDQDISLDIIGERMHYNPNYLSSIFKKEFGRNFSDYLIGYRIEKAKELLEKSELTIKSISEKLQYKNSQNFIRSFRKYVQMTPGEYRKQKAKK